MNILIQIYTPTKYRVHPNTMIVRTLGYGDPIMVEREGLDQKLTGDNFNHVDFWASEGVNPKTGVHYPNWGAISKFQPLTGLELEYLKAIQPDDYDNYGFTIKQKMNWLIGDATNKPPSRPYWTKGGSWDGHWDTFVFGTMVFGNSLVRIKTNIDGSPKITKFLTIYKSYNTFLTGEVEFVEVVGITPTMFSYPVEWLLENGYIQQATEVIGPDNKINSIVRGVVFHPIWDPAYYKNNFGYMYLPKFAIDFGT